MLKWFRNKIFLGLRGNPTGTHWEVDLFNPYSHFHAQYTRVRVVDKNGRVVATGTWSLGPPGSSYAVRWAAYKAREELRANRKTNQYIGVYQ